MKNRFFIGMVNGFLINISIILILLMLIAVSVSATVNGNDNLDLLLYDDMQTDNIATNYINNAGTGAFYFQSGEGYRRGISQSQTMLLMNQETGVIASNVVGFQFDVKLYLGGVPSGENGIIEIIDSGEVWLSEGIKNPCGGFQAWARRSTNAIYLNSMGAYDGETCSISYLLDAEDRTNDFLSTSWQTVIIYQDRTSNPADPRIIIIFPTKSYNLTSPAGFNINSSSLFGHTGLQSDDTEHERPVYKNEYLITDSLLISEIVPTFEPPTPESDAHINDFIINITCSNDDINLYVSDDLIIDEDDRVATNETSPYAYSGLALADDTYYYTANCGYDNSNTTLRNLTKDNLNPAITWINPSSDINIYNDYRILANVTDSFLNAVNLTVYNNSNNEILFTNYTDSLTVDSYIWNDLIPFSSYGIGSYKVEVCARDSLTSSPYLTDYKVKIKDKDKIIDSKTKKNDDSITDTELNIQYYDKYNYIYDTTVSSNNKKLKDSMIIIDYDTKHFKETYYIEYTPEVLNNGIDIKITGDSIKYYNRHEVSYFTIDDKYYRHYNDIKENIIYSAIKTDNKNSGYSLHIDYDPKISQLINKDNNVYWVIDPITGGLNTNCENSSIISYIILPPESVILSPNNEQTVNKEFYLNINVTDVYDIGFKSNISLYYGPVLINELYNESENLNNTDFLINSSLYDSINYTILYTAENEKGISESWLNISFDNIAPIISVNDIINNSVYDSVSITLNITEQSSFYLFYNLGAGGVTFNNGETLPLIEGNNLLDIYATDIFNQTSQHYIYSLNITSPPTPTESVFQVGTCQLDTLQNTLMFIFIGVIIFFIWFMAESKIKIPFISIFTALMIIYYFMLLFACQSFIGGVGMGIGLILLFFEFSR